MKRFERINRNIATYYDYYQHIESEQVLWLRDRDFLMWAAPWRAAAKAAGLQFRKGRVYTGNNRYYLPFMILPKWVLQFSNDLGDVFYEPGEIQVASVTYVTKEKMYCILPVCPLTSENWWDASGDMRWFFSEMLWKMIPRQKAKKTSVKEKSCISKRQLQKLVAEYFRLFVKQFGNVTDCSFLSYSMWEQPGADKHWKYWIRPDTDLPDVAEASPCSFSRDLSLGAVFELLLSLTVFSICKPLLNAAGLPVAFSVSIQPRQTISETDFFYYIREWSFFVCDVTQRKKLYKDKNFERTGVGVLAPFIHHSFPLLYRKYDPLKDDFVPGRTYYTDKEMKDLSKASCLPIILSSVEKPHQYDDKNCLAIPAFIDSRTKNKVLRSQSIREQLLDFYSDFLGYLSLNSQTLVKTAGRDYTAILANLGISKALATPDQQHIGCILVALQWLRTYLKDRGAKDDLFISELERLYQKRTGKPAAGLTTFATFLRDLLQSPEKDAVLFCEDRQYLYLHYKAYWPAFEAYCQQHNFFIRHSAAGFRREYLRHEYLKPQYRQKQGQYPRYDYRKKSDGKEATVLALSKNILAQAIR